MDKNKKSINNTEGVLVDIFNISYTKTSNCCINMNYYNCNKCYIQEFKFCNNTNINNSNSNDINKPLIDLYTIPKKYNIDDIIFLNKNNTRDNKKNR
jgi:hypothetical protein